MRGLAEDEGPQYGANNPYTGRQYSSKYYQILAKRKGTPSQASWHSLCGDLSALAQLHGPEGGHGGLEAAVDGRMPLEQPCCRPGHSADGRVVDLPNKPSALLDLPGSVWGVGPVLMRKAALLQGCRCGRPRPTSSR